jgi:hypothetical protein
VTVENGIARNRKDATGDFLRGAIGPDLFITSAGYMECISASGRLLSKGDVKEALKRFQSLPESERAPGAVQVPEHGPYDQQHPPAPPEGGLVLKIHGRMLAREPEGRLRHVRLDDFPLMARRDDLFIEASRHLTESNLDLLWITRSEWQSLVPQNPTAGQRVRVPDSIVLRVCRFHLIPTRMYGEGGEWRLTDVRRGEMELVVEAVTPGEIRFSAVGACHMGSEFDADKATVPNGPLPRGYAADLRGHLVYDRSAERFVRIDLLAMGESWGRMGDANNNSVAIERPGCNPMLFALELAADSPAERGLIPTGRASTLARYFTAEKP